MKHEGTIILVILILLIIAGGVHFGLFASYPPNSIFATDDSYVDEHYSDREYGSSQYLKVRGDNSEHDRWVYIKFKIPQTIRDVVRSGVELDEASLSVYSGNIYDGMYVQLRKTSNGWNEDTLNWINKPAPGEIIAEEDVTIFREREWITFTGIGDYIEEKINAGETEISFVLNNEEGIKGHGDFNSREAGGGINPYLVIYYTPPECIIGQQKCEGLVWFTCSSEGKWVEEGLVVGKCGYYSEPLQLSENQLVAMECFNQGTITKQSTRYPVIVFGGNVLPAIVLDGEYNEVHQDPTIYNDLNAGDSLVIPETQVWCLFYIIENNYQLPTTCNIVDVETEECAVVNPGIVTICSEGVFDTNLGLCVIQAYETVCEYGYYNIVEEKCIYHPPLIEYCPEGSDYDPSTQTCVYYPEEDYVCDSGFTYNTDTGKCEATPDFDYICPEGDLVFVGGNPTCRITPDEVIKCPADFNYDEDEDKCIKYPDVWQINPTGFWEENKALLIIFAVLFILILFMRRR